MLFVKRSRDAPSVTDRGDTSRVDEALRKIGRNVVLFQKIEGMLKSLSWIVGYAGSLDEIRRQHEKHSQGLRKKSFGQVVALFFDQVCVDAEDASLRPGAFALRFTIRDVERRELKEMLEALVSERNELVHTRLLGFGGRSERECIEMETFLDAQHERLRPAFEKVSELFEITKSARPLIVEAIAEEVGMNADEQGA